MLYILLTHLRALFYDLLALQSEGDWPTGPAAGFANAGMLLLSEIVGALEAYHVTHNKYDLHRACIMAGLDFSTRWETWIDSLKPADLTTVASKVFHEQLLRWFKGAIKAYRIWLIDRRQ